MQKKCSLQKIYNRIPAFRLKDEFTNKPILDENGRLIQRENYCFVTLNCGEDDFAIACMKANLQYGKNRSRGDVKSHHYIISFDPRDAVENGLTVIRHRSWVRNFAVSTSQDIKRLSALTPTVTITVEISTAILSLTACGLRTCHYFRIWTDPPTRAQAASTAAPRRL